MPDSFRDLSQQMAHEIAIESSALANTIGRRDFKIRWVSDDDVITVEFEAGQWSNFELKRLTVAAQSLREKARRMRANGIQCVRDRHDED